MADGTHRGLPAQVKTPSPGDWRTIHQSRRPKQDKPSVSRTRSRTPIRKTDTKQPRSPPNKKQHLNQDDTSSETSDSMHVDDPKSSPSYSFLLSNFDPKFQNPKQLLHQFLKYVSRQAISQIIPTRNGVIVKSPDPKLATTIRDKHTLEIFGKSATMTSLTAPRPKQPPVPRKSPLLSVVIYGVEPTWTDEEITDELRQQEYDITKVIRIKCQSGPTYLVRILTQSQETINDLLTLGAYIYCKRHRVEPSRTPPPMPIRCEKCQSYNSHPTHQCPNPPKCGFCTGPHATRQCTNTQLPPKCSTCDQPHPTYSYQCKSRPQPETTKPDLVVPLRVTEQPPNHISPDKHPILQEPITVEQLLSFVTLTLQNVQPSQRPHILQQIQNSAQQVFHVTFHATYSGPFVHFVTAPPTSSP